MFAEQSTAQIRAELGARLRAHRRSRKQTQQALAEQAGVSRPTLSKLERGIDGSLETLLAVLRALDLLDALDTAIAPPPQSPIAELGRSRKRPHEVPSRWQWGDEK